MAKNKGGLFGMVLATTAALATAAFFSKKQNRTKVIRVAKKLEKRVIKAEKKLVKKTSTKKTSMAKKSKKTRGIKRK